MAKKNKRRTTEQERERKRSKERLLLAEQKMPRFCETNDG
jgi:hypothetical protein